MKRIKIAPSILSADFSCLDKEIERVESAGADLLHIDVMDGHFVPNITIGPAVVKSIRKVTKLPLDVHLMIENPEVYVDNFIDAGSDMITVHIETISDAKIKTLKAKLEKRNILLGISLNPATPLKKIKKALKCADFVLVMSVNPGFGGQKFIPAALSKVRSLRKIFSGEISVDGGVNNSNADKLIAAGATILAAGSYIFGAGDKRKAIESIRGSKSLAFGKKG
ncbi:MAG: ribulose-phosphate 3-epimerase [Candidatus Omnitrophica bacterium]|nr:ribulose-phosphate 3-epimerase [Candidatus Omnitrophota bacterium]